MKIKNYNNGVIEIMDDSVIIREIDDVLSILSTNTCDTIILKKENIKDEFFNLSTGFAGELLQKFSTYRIRLAIIGDYTNIASKALRDFIHESNKRKQILFVETAEEAIKLFNAGSTAC
jgi:hypothetical protein